MNESPSINFIVGARLPTGFGNFRIALFVSQPDGKEHIALVMGDLQGKSGVLTRVHSECFTGDVFASQRCDCGEQLQLALQAIAAEGQGVLLYLRQEGRGIGLKDKLVAYNLQDQGLDTVEANLALGHQADERDYTPAVAMLNSLGVRSVRLLTNNPNKISQLSALGIAVDARLPLTASINRENARYLLTKAQRMNHLLDADALASSLANRKNGDH